jgi:hypothetical protein
MGPQSHKSPSCRNFGTPTGESYHKMTFGWDHKVYYKGEGGGFPQVQAVVNFVSSSLPVARPSTKSASTMH